MTTKPTPPPANDDPAKRPAPAGTTLPVREALHALVAAATWLLFFYWWWIVLPQVRRDDAVVAGLFIALTSLATALLTAAWVHYNLGIYRRKGPRLTLPPAVPERDTDALGRKIVRPDDASLRAARVIDVAVDGGRKTIGPSEAD